MRPVSDIGRFLSSAAGHLRTVARHRRLVRRGCFRAGLIRQGLCHDLSKFSPSELLPSIRYYTDGKGSPIGAQRRAEGISGIWLHHKGRNRHHFEYWTDWSFGSPPQMQGMKMPPRYLAEMLIDRVCASKVYGKDGYTDASALQYTLDRPWQNAMIHPETLREMLRLFTVLRDRGENAFYQEIRAMLRRGSY